MSNSNGQIIYSFRVLNPESECSSLCSGGVSTNVSMPTSASAPVSAEHSEHSNQKPTNSIFTMYRIIIGEKMVARKFSIQSGTFTSTRIYNKRNRATNTIERVTKQISRIGKTFKEKIPITDVLVYLTNVILNKSEEIKLECTRDNVKIDAKQAIEEILLLSSRKGSITHTGARESVNASITNASITAEHEQAVGTHIIQHTETKVKNNLDPNPTPTLEELNARLEIVKQTLPKPHNPYSDENKEAKERELVRNSWIEDIKRQTEMATNLIISENIEKMQKNVNAINDGDGNGNDDNSDANVVNDSNNNDNDATKSLLNPLAELSDVLKKEKEKKNA